LGRHAKPRIGRCNRRAHKLRILARIDAITTEATIDAPTRLALRVAPGCAPDFEVWRWALSPMWDAAVVAAATRNDFDFLADSSIFGSPSIGRIRASQAARYRRSGCEIARSDNDQIMVTTHDGSGMDLPAGRREVQARAGDMVFLDLGQPAELCVAAGARITCMMPRPMLEPLLPAMHDLHGLVIPAGQALAPLLHAHMQSLLIHAAGFSETQRRNMMQGLAHLLAATADPLGDARPEAEKAVAAVKFRQVREAFDVHLADPALGPGFLARRCHVPRASLYRTMAAARSATPCRRCQKPRTALGKAPLPPLPLPPETCKLLRAGVR
jgi:hypothetical protein